MHETDFRSSLQTGGDYRRLKTTIALIIVYAATIGLHLAPWSKWVLLGLFSIQALRLIFAPDLPAIATEQEQSPNQELPFFSLLASAKNEDSVIANPSKIYVS